MSRQNSLYRKSIQTSVSSTDTNLSESLFQKQIDSTIDKWSNLQKILKENQSLEKNIEKQHLENYNQMKQYLNDFYKLKITSRKLYEDIKFLKMENISYKKEKNFYIEELSGNYFGNTSKPLENLIAIIRGYYDYVTKIVYLIDEKDKKEEIESLAEFFCNQFYTNIFIPNPEQEELLICIYKLLEQEINKMDIADLDNFLSDSTFIGKFMTCFSKMQESNNFFVNLLSKTFNEVDKRNKFLLDLSLNKMMKYIKQEKKNINNIIINNVRTLSIYDNFTEEEEIKKRIGPIERILEKIPKTKINFKKHLIIEKEIFRKSHMSSNESSSIYSDDIEFDLEDDIKDLKGDFNLNYLEDLSRTILSQKIKDFSEPDLISFYKHLINQLNEKYHDQYAFGNSGFFMLLRQDYFIDEKEIIGKIYFKNFLFIQEKIDDIIQSLIDKMAAIPYAVRCICTIIDKLIEKYFPKLHKYRRHSFIGKFLFNKCIFPILNLENTNGLKNNIFTHSQIDCLKCIVSVISNANNCELFDIYNDVEKTMFNYYLLEIIPILNKFYDKLVDIQLPNQLNELINNSVKIENFDLKKNNFLFDIEEDKENLENKENNLDKNKDSNYDNKDNKQAYDYFKENSNEIIRIKSICFHEKDILFILKLINRNIDLFEDLPDFKRFKLALQQRGMNENDLEKIIFEQKKMRKEKKIDKENKGEGYYTLIINEQNSQLNYNLKEFYKEDKKEKKVKEKSLLSRIKNSIKLILRRLNILNTKEYSYLNFASSNENFFQAIDYTLKDLEDEDNKVPLSWHSNFIVNNIDQLDQNYLKNDFQNIYEEIFNEEKNHLSKLKSVIPIINAKEEMNLNCAENAIEKIKVYNKNLERTKKSEKVKIFILRDKTEVCIDTFDKIRLSYTNSFRDEINKGQYITVKPADKCRHFENKLFSKAKIKNNKIDSHINNVNEFIYIFIKPREATHETILNYIKDDIKTGVPTHKIYSLFSRYKELLKQSLLKNFKELIEDKSDPDEILEKIEDYILRKIYKYVFPSEPSLEDSAFHKLTESYDWLKATDFSAKGNIPLEAIKDSIFYLTQMEEKAKSTNEKLKCIEMIYNNINKITEFYFDKDDKSADTQIPFFNYIITKAHPKRFLSNINYIKCFTAGKDIGKYDLLINNCTSSIEFICNINASSLKMTKDEFRKKCNETIKKFPK